MHARFYAPAAHTPGDVIALPPEEAVHLTRVLRLSRGARVIVFNGRGQAFDAVVRSARKNGVDVDVGPPCAAAREPRIAVTLIQSVLKGDRMDDVVRDAVMIGAAAVQPVVAARSEVTLPPLARGHRRERWERVAISSAKQCGRAVVPPILEPLPLDAVLALLDEQHLPMPAFMLVEPAAADGVPLRGVGDPEVRKVSLMIGPEGGWTPDERAQASWRCRLVTLGDRTIRADAMALVAIAALFATWGEY